MTSEKNDKEDMALYPIGTETRNAPNIREEGGKGGGLIALGIGTPAGDGLNVEAPGTGKTFKELFNLPAKDFLETMVPGQTVSWREFLSPKKEQPDGGAPETLGEKEQETNNDEKGNGSPSVARLAKQNSANGGLSK